MPKTPDDSTKDKMSESAEGGAPLISMRQLELINIGIRCSKDKGGFDVEKFARMGGYKSTSVASTTWCRVKRHLQKIAPVEDPNPPADADEDKERKRDGDGDGERSGEGGPVKKRGRVSKAVGSDDELAPDGVKAGTGGKGKCGKGKKGPVGKDGLTPDGDSQDGALNCITVKGSDDEDGPASRNKRKAAKGAAAKGGKAGSGKGKKRVDATAVDEAEDKGIRESDGGSGAESGTKKGKSEKSSGDVFDGKREDAENSETADEDAIVVKGRKDDVDAEKVDGSRGDAASIAAAPAEEASKVKRTKGDGVDAKKAKGAAAGDFTQAPSVEKITDPSEKEAGCIEVAPAAEANKANNSKAKPTKATKGSGSSKKETKGKLSTDSDSVETASVKKTGQVKATKTTTTKTTKTTKGNAKAKKESEKADCIEVASAEDNSMATKDEKSNDSGAVKSAETETAKTNEGGPAKKSRQDVKFIKSTKNEPADDSGRKAGAAKSDGAPVKKTHTAKEDKLSVKYVIDGPEGSDVIPDSQDSEMA